ncbi:DUF3054 domain-containing protein [Corynebacterium sp. H127]|uniref:DUF3054 domain-containing protein n=1 Tax=Corynebacterium sp. H127 TaxID=3133418 RepID=UPI0030B7A969
MKYFFYDVIAILAFAIFARLAHKSEPFTVANILDTWWPFLVGVALAWAIIAALKLRATSLLAGSFVWVLSAVGGLSIWGIRNGHVPHISFIIVATVMSGLLLLGWRLLAGRIRR